MAANDVETRLEQLEQQNNALMTLLQKFADQPAAPAATNERALLSPKIVNNGWKPMFNPKHPNPDNRDWEPGTPKRWDPDLGYKRGYSTFHTGDGKWEWGYKNPETGEIIWSGKIVGEQPPGPPAEPPLPYEDLERHLTLAGI